MKRILWAGQDSNLRRRTPADLQSALFDRSRTDPETMLARYEMARWIYLLSMVT